jgi:hypothetical protein
MDFFKLLKAHYALEMLSVLVLKNFIFGIFLQFPKKTKKLIWQIDEASLTSFALWAMGIIILN